jgi:hypothetical protein
MTGSMDMFIHNLLMVTHFTCLGYVLTAGIVQLIFAPKAGRDETARWILTQIDRFNPLIFSGVVATGALLLMQVPVEGKGASFPWTRVLLLSVIFFCTALVMMKSHAGRLKNAVGGLLLLRFFMIIILMHILFIQTRNPVMSLPDGSVEARLFWARLLHNGFGLLVIGGAWLVLLGTIHVFRDMGEVRVAGGTRIRKLGAFLVIKCTLLQVFTGLWLMVVQPKKMNLLFSGETSSMLFILSMAGVLLLLLTGVMVLVMQAKKWPVFLLWFSLLIVLTGMISARHLLQERRKTDTALTSGLHQGALNQSPQYSSASMKVHVRPCIYFIHVRPCSSVFSAINPPHPIPNSV